MSRVISRGDQSASLQDGTSILRHTRSSVVTASTTATLLNVLSWSISLSAYRNLRHDVHRGNKSSRETNGWAPWIYRHKPLIFDVIYTVFIETLNQAKQTCTSLSLSFCIIWWSCWRSRSTLPLPSISDSSDSRNSSPTARVSLSCDIIWSCNSASSARWFAANTARRSSSFIPHRTTHQCVINHTLSL